VKIWTPDRSDPIVTLLAHDASRWLAISPPGFFSGTPTGGELFSIIRGLDVFRVDQVHQSLFNPDLVLEMLAGDPNGEAEEAANVINLDKVLESGPAPAVVIMSTLPGNETRADLLGVEARIHDKGKGVGRIEWRVNGVTTAVAARPEGSGPQYTLARELALDPGENTIEVVAYNASNLLASVPARTTVKFVGSADPARPKLHVLAIGIDRYIDQGWVTPGSIRPLAFRPLALAVKDATSIADGLKQAAGNLYADVRVTLALNEAAARDRLDETMNRLGAEIHPRDTFVFFAAAHGISDDGRFYLIPQDHNGGSNPAALQSRAIGQERLQDWFANRIKAKKAVILLDTCESGALIAGHLRSRTDVAASEAGVGRLHEATGRPVLTAAALGQFAYEGLIGRFGSRHGLFTYALLDALRSGDTNTNGHIELSELVSHVQALVPKLAADLGGTGRSAFALPPLPGVQQSARFGSRGEDFPLVGRLQ
jgi:hypothetical protein